ncbi:MAG: hypothetical protein ND895_08970 [Pyrinomonadaceae bacterium]|nr:hypothetical protein [Pyrinomonadaceae bacterium]
MTNSLGRQTLTPKNGKRYQTLSGVVLASIGIITSAAALLSIFCIAVLVGAQNPAVGDREAASSLPNPQLAFVGKDAYEVNGTKGTRFKLSVTNRASHPDFLWLPSANLPPCGENNNASRTWVEIFGSPGDKRLYGFCALRSSDDLDSLWFAVPSGEKGPPCVYIVMTDRRTGKKYTSNRVCSRLFTVVTGSLKAGGKQKAAKERKAGMTESEAEKLATSHADVQGGFGWDSIGVMGYGNAASHSKEPTNKRANVAQPDLIIKQFLFPPTNNKALRLQVANTGNAASGACRLFLTVRRINGVAVGRRTHVNVPALAAGAEVWLVIDAKSILPNNVSLQSTTFKLNVDATGIVAESNESNNEAWHNL